MFKEVPGIILLWMYFIILKQTKCIHAVYNDTQEISKEEPHFEVLQFKPNWTESSSEYTIPLNFKLPSTLKVRFESPQPIPTRSKRNVFFTRPVTCEVTAEEINGLCAAVDEASQILKSPYATSSSQFISHFTSTSSNTSGCSQQMTEIKTIINNIITDISLIKKSSSDQTRAYAAALRRIEDNEAKFREQIDQVEKSANQTIQSNVRRLEDSLQVLGNVIKDIKEKNADLRQKLCEKRIQAIISKLQLAQFEEAEKEFEEFDFINKDSMDRITKAVYSSTRIDGFKAMIMFTNHVGYCGVFKVVVSTMYEEMKAENHLVNPNVIMFKNWIDLWLSVVGDKIPSSEKSEVEATLRNLESDISTLISFYATNIRNGDYNITLREIENNFKLVEPYFFEIMRESYNNNKDRLDQILPFIRSTITLRTHLGLLNELFDIMNSSNDIYSSKGLELISEIERVRSTVVLPPSSVAVIDSIKAKVPSGYRFIIGSPLCRIVSALWNEDLYAATKLYNYGWKRRLVYISNKGMTHQSWRIIPQNYGKHFVIKESFYNEYLYATILAYKFDEESGHVFTYQPAGQPSEYGEWYIEPTTITGERGIVLFKNKQLSEYLYLSNFKYETNKYMVFTFKSPSDRQMLLSTWKIICD